ncbi:hypothetical protein MPTK1_7g00970 [Marchantia polymorpha subsp. ruderalis]|uniref:AMP-activated protein kinase glycogen-binding domain-containing protein n=2 Tax=Marchantia polymorpha TaxID=3197 RepID=A0AAF6BUW8_MARPO|nr:hypothetical protein MARPO_0046s0027 [Marchantia polymorpha]BBN15802.1 hypothetical protein Mp_7g00970 [Marchantia polymorpha subsp. ruderalis]|eukprot:PTQ39204.1 hypothetical protein MARPO_0046s0027 [Marchantia polymorpha]
MAAMTVEFALNPAKSAASWSFGRSRVEGRNVCRLTGTERVAFASVACKDGGKGKRRLLWVACADPSGSSSSQPKPRKARSKCEGPTKNDLKLVKDLKEFMCACDLPPTEVPTTKDLIRNGRQDLANAVRRRGYKVVAHLLGLAPGPEAAHSTSTDEAKESTAISTTRDSSVNGAAGNFSAESHQASRKGDNETGCVTVFNSEAESLSPGRSVSEGESLNEAVSLSEGTLRESLASSPTLVPEILNTETQKQESVGQTSLGVKADYIQERQLNIIKGASQTLDLLQKLNSGSKSEDGVDGNESESDYSDDEYEDDEEDDKDSIIGVPVPGPGSSFESPEEFAATKAALLKSRILEYFDSRKEDQVKPESIQDARTTEQLAMEQVNNVLERDTELENNQKLEVEKELERFRDLLHARELVLSEVTQELEEAKAQFSLARAKATAELVHATQLAVEREARLQQAEQTLASLRQVHLEWWGEAGQVEVAGTFNGWQHRILMEPDPSSEIPKADGSRGPMMWGTHLCLYPGIYEIKFIVDGNWQLDHRREVVMRHGNQNNVLRVE